MLANDLNDLDAAQGLFGRKPTNAGLIGRLVNPWGTAQQQFSLPDNSAIIHVAPQVQMPWADTSNISQPKQGMLGGALKTVVGGELGGMVGGDKGAAIGSNVAQGNLIGALGNTSFGQTKIGQMLTNPDYFSSKVNTNSQQTSVSQRMQNYYKNNNKQWTNADEQED